MFGAFFLPPWHPKVVKTTVHGIIGATCYHYHNEIQDTGLKGWASAATIFFFANWILESYEHWWDRQYLSSQNPMPALRASRESFYGLGQNPMLPI